jgi:hypothetical protein
MRCCDCEYRKKCTHRESDIVGFQECETRTKMNRQNQERKNSKVSKEQGEPKCEK